jgi:hypothetical protein
MISQIISTIKIVRVENYENEMAMHVAYRIDILGSLRNIPQESFPHKNSQ